MTHIKAGGRLFGTLLIIEIVNMIFLMGGMSLIAVGAANTFDESYHIIMFVVGVIVLILDIFTYSRVHKTGCLYRRLRQEAARRAVQQILAVERYAAGVSERTFPEVTPEDILLLVALADRAHSHNEALVAIRNQLETLGMCFTRDMLRGPGEPLDKYTGLLPRGYLNVTAARSAVTSFSPEGLSLPLPACAIPGGSDANGLAAMSFGPVPPPYYAAVSPDPSIPLDLPPSYSDVINMTSQASNPFAEGKSMTPGEQDAEDGRGLQPATAFNIAHSNGEEGFTNDAYVTDDVESLCGSPDSVDIDCHV